MSEGFGLMKVHFFTFKFGMRVPVRHELHGNLSGNFLIAHGETWVTFSTTDVFIGNPISSAFHINVTILEYTGMFEYLVCLNLCLFICFSFKKELSHRWSFPLFAIHPHKNYYIVTFLFLLAYS